MRPSGAATGMEDFKCVLLYHTGGSGYTWGDNLLCGHVIGVSTMGLKVGTEPFSMWRQATEPFVHLRRLGRDGEAALPLQRLLARWD